MTTLLKQFHEGLYQHNYMIGGNHDFFMEGDVTSIADGAYGATLTKHGVTGAAVIDATKSSDVPTYIESGYNSQNSLLYAVTTIDASIAAGDYVIQSRFIEGYDFQNLHGDYITISFWVKAFKAGVYCIALRNSGTDRSYVTEYTIDNSDVWQQITKTVNMNEFNGIWDYTNGFGIEIILTLASGSTFQTGANTWTTGNYLATPNQVNGVDSTSNTFRVAQFSVNKGKKAIPFQRAGKDIIDELNKYHRYFCKTYDTETDLNTNTTVGVIRTVSNANNNLAGIFSFPVHMRITPTATAHQNDGSGDAQWEINEAATISSNYLGLGRLVITGLASASNSVRHIHVSASARF